MFSRFLSSILIFSLVTLPCLAQTPDSSSTTLSTRKPSNKKLTIPPAPYIPTKRTGFSDNWSSAGQSTLSVKNVVSPTSANHSKTVIIGSGGPYTLVSRSNEQYLGLFNWQPEEQNDPLTMKISFSPIGVGGFRSLRVLLGNRVLATESTLRGKEDLSLDLTGSVATGTNQIVIEGQGAPGAQVSWSLSSIVKVKLSKVEPDDVCVGESVTLTGKHFDPEPTQDIVTLGKKAVPASSASSDKLKITVPKDTTPGTMNVFVTVDGSSTKPQSITVRGIPVLTGTNFEGIPPGAELTIYGKNFSKKLGENKVYIGDAQAVVTGGNTEQLSVIVPDFGGEIGTIGGQFATPVRVVVGKIPSINTIPVTVGNSMWQSPGFRFGPGTPTVPVDWRQLLQ